MKIVFIPGDKHYIYIYIYIYYKLVLWQYYWFRMNFCNVCGTMKILGYLCTS